MKTVSLADEAEERLLMLIPVLKLPAVNLEKSLNCLVSARRELRKEVIAAVLRDIYPQMNPKRAFRALVAPVLTRLHFARSDPPLFFRSAPNARIWKTTGNSLKRSYTSIVLFDFATVRLGLKQSMVPPAGSLRQMAEGRGERIIDRIRGLDSFLRFYAPFHPNFSSQSRKTITVAAPADFNGREGLSKLLLSNLPAQRMTLIDEARYMLQTAMQSQNILASSFVVDEWLKMGIRERIISYAKAPYASISSLSLDRLTINAIVSPGGD